MSAKSSHSNNKFHRALFQPIPIKASNKKTFTKLWDDIRIPNSRSNRFNVFGRIFLQKNRQILTAIRPILRHRRDNTTKNLQYYPPPLEPLPGPVVSPRKPSLSPAISLPPSLSLCTVCRYRINQQWLRWRATGALEGESSCCSQTERLQGDSHLSSTQTADREF